MKRFVLDTDLVSLLRQRSPELARRVWGNPEAVTVSVITVEEQFGGWYTLLRKATQSERLERAYRELAEAARLFGRLTILDFDRPAMARFDSLVRQKLNVKKNDLRIAAIALEVGAVVVTRNVRDFGRVPGLLVEDWLRPPA